MVSGTSELSAGRLLEQRERLTQEQPELSQSFDRFLRDWEEYRKLQRSTLRPREARDYPVFGASFQE
jgi:hypothetical protein